MSKCCITGSWYSVFGLAVALILIGMCCCYCMFCGKDAWIYNCRDKDGDEKDTKDTNVEGGQPKIVDQRNDVETKFKAIC